MIGVGIQLVLLVCLLVLSILAVTAGKFWSHFGFGVLTFILTALAAPILYIGANIITIFFNGVGLLVITVICGLLLIAGALFFKYNGQWKIKKATWKDTWDSNKVLILSLLVAELSFFVALSTYQTDITKWFSISGSDSLLKNYVALEILIALALFVGGRHVNVGKKSKPGVRMCVFNSFILGTAVSLALIICFMFTQRSFLPSPTFGMFDFTFYLNYDENREKFDYSYYEYYGYSYMSDAEEDRDFLKRVAQQIDNGETSPNVMGEAVERDKNPTKGESPEDKFYHYYLEAYVDATEKGFKNGIMIVVFSLIIFHYEIRKKIEGKDVEGAWDGRVQALIRTVPLVLMFCGLWLPLELVFKNIFYEVNGGYYAFSKFSLMDSVVTGVEYGGVIAAIWIFIKKPNNDSNLEKTDSGRRRVGSRKIYTRRR